MSGGSGSGREMARWTDEEHDILVRLTNDQIDLESQDPSREISWAALWRRVASQLGDLGFHRSDVACRGYWRRVVETRKSPDQDAPGSRWDEREQRILIDVTEDQLALEKESPEAVVPWSRHWKYVSSRLLQEGFHRSPHACSAHWVRLGNELSEKPGKPEEEDSKDPGNGSDGVVDRGGMLDSPSESPEAGEETHTPQDEDQEPREAEAQEEEPNDEEHDGELRPSAPRHILPSNATSVFTPTATPGPSEQDISEDEYRPRNREPSSKSKMSQILIKPESPPPLKSKIRGFRFNATQRAILEAEAASNGTYPDSRKRAELAYDLEVEEKTIRNWFVHRRSHKGQHQHLSSNQSRASSANESFDASATPGSLKRGPFTLDHKDSSLSVDEDAMDSQARDDHQSKRMRLKPDFPQHFTEEPSPHVSPYPVGSVAMRSDRPDEEEPRHSFGSSTDASRHPSMAGSSASRETAATTISSRGSMGSSFPAVNIFGDGALQTTGQGPGPRRIEPGTEPDLQQPTMKKSPTPISGALWNPVNNGPRSNPYSNTPTPTPVGAHPYGKPPPRSQITATAAAAATPPPGPRQASAASPPLSDDHVAGSDKEMFFRKANTYRAQIDTLNREVASRLQNMTQIEQSLDSISNDYRAVVHERDQIIRQSIMEIEARYADRLHKLQEHQASMAQDRELELEILDRTSNEVKKKTKALGHVQALLAMADDEDE